MSSLIRPCGARRRWTGRRWRTRCGSRACARLCTAALPSSAFSSRSLACCPCIASARGGLLRSCSSSRPSCSRPRKRGSGPRVPCSGRRSRCCFLAASATTRRSCLCRGALRTSLRWWLLASGSTSRSFIPRTCSGAGRRACTGSGMGWCPRRCLCSRSRSRCGSSGRTGRRASRCWRIWRTRSRWRRGCCALWCRTGSRAGCWRGRAWT
mmetsp:Transcript_66085/g.137749  ORF Transcript_66085/g.137749 Transcript_66085/m.137749 type:complete len:210 (+) Transcript_66085:224-853(+)